VSDIFIVRARPDGWEIIRKPDGSTQRIRIAHGLKKWSEVQTALDEAAERLGGYAWPEERTPARDVFSLRLEPDRAEPIDP
jgi:hypothetical protein